MLADVRFERTDGVIVVSVGGDVDMSNADEIASALLRALTNDVLAVILDLTDADYFDSAGIHLLYDLLERLRTRGQQLRIVVPAESTAYAALELSAVLQAIDVHETLEAAMAALPGADPGSPPSA